MSKKIISLLLAVMLTVSMVAVAAVSVSAETDADGRFVPTAEKTHRYYFYVPSEWQNEYYENCRVYWWTGPDTCANGWPGELPQKTEIDNIFYVDLAYFGDGNGQNVSQLIWNNGIDGGEDSTQPIYSKACQTVDIPCEYYDVDENEYYPDGLDGETGFDNMIYVLDSQKKETSQGEFNPGKTLYGGEWYYYYGNGKYGFQPTIEEAEAVNGVFSSEMHTPGVEDPTTEPTTVAPETTTVAAETTEAPTEAPTEGTTAAPVSPYLTVYATSNYFPQATAQYDETTNEVTVTYQIKSSMDMLNTQWELDFDKDVFSVDTTKNKPSTVMPACTTGKVVNLAKANSEGRILGNATSLDLYKISETDTTFVTVVFDVKDISAVDPLSTTINLDLQVLNVSKLGDDEISHKEFDIALVRNSEVLDTDAAKSVAVSTHTLLTPSTYVEPTTVAPTTAAPTTVAPTTAAPTTAAPTTAAPTVAPTTAAPTTAAPTVAPTTAAPTVAPTTSAATTVATEATTVAPTTSAATTVATEATTVAPTSEGSTVPTATAGVQSSTSATVKSNSTADTATNNGAVQTGDASLAVIILTLLIAATGVMFVLRKREMF